MAAVGQVTAWSGKLSDTYTGVISTLEIKKTVDVNVDYTIDTTLMGEKISVRRIF